MRILQIPKVGLDGDYIVFNRSIAEQEINRGLFPGTYGKVKVYGARTTQWIHWPLLVGDWYRIRKIIWFASLSSPVVSLAIDRSKKGRGWAKRRMSSICTKVEEELKQQGTYYSHSRVIELSSTNLNSNCTIVSSYEEAIEYSKKVQGQNKCMHNANIRWSQIDLT